MSPPFVAAPPTPALAPAKRFNEVDSLRAIACALVIISHTGTGQVNLILAGPLAVGQIGVLFFFAISGFVIPGSLRGGRWQGLLHFFTRRFWRLYPPFWFSLLLTWWIDESYIAKQAEQWHWDALMLPRLGFVGQGFKHFWTLEIELVFYLLVAALFFIFGRLGWRVLLLSYLLLGVFSILEDFTSEVAISYDSLSRYLVLMFFGGLCREILYFNFSHWHWLAPKRRVDWARSTVLGVVSGIVIIVQIVACCTMNRMGRSFALAALLAVLGFLLWTILKPVQIGWLSKVGRWTYSTYLLHLFAIMLAYSLSEGFYFFSVFFHIPLFFTGFVLVVSFAIGAVAYRWIEQPSDAVGRWLTGRRAE